MPIGTKSRYGCLASFINATGEFWVDFPDAIKW